MKKIKVSQNVANKIKRHRENFKLEFFCVGRNGGSNVDTSSTGVRIRDKITGLFCEYTRERSQKQNLKCAFENLVIKLIEFYKKEEKREELKEKGENLKNDKIIRTYNEKENRVTDERLEGSFSYKEVLEGKIDSLVEKLMLLD
jgi:peptide chain release factor 1